MSWWTLTFCCNRSRWNMVQTCCKQQSSFGVLKEIYRQRIHSVCWTSTCPEVTWTGGLGALTMAATNHNKTVQFEKAITHGKLFCTQRHLRIVEVTTKMTLLRTSMALPRIQDCVSNLQGTQVPAALDCNTAALTPLHWPTRPSSQLHSLTSWKSHVVSKTAHLWCKYFGI